VSGSFNWPWTTELSPWELATRFTDTASYFVSEASVYRLLKAHELITSLAYIVMKAADEFKDKTTAPNQLWPTDFTYFKVTGWGWFHLSTVLDDFSRYIIAWKLCTIMKAQDVTDTLDLALAASGCDQARIALISHPGDIVIMDNFGSHKGKAVRRFIRAAGAKLIFLPKYSPDLNPIE
jgi:transposase InsO family protein